MPSKSGRTILFALALVLVVIVAYAQCVNYPFVYDDRPGIFDDPLTSHAETIAQAGRALFEMRPATNFSYALTHALFGFSNAAFHATNVVIHIVNTLLVFAIAVLLARRWLPEFRADYFGFIAGAIHATHPLYTEAVTYISGRSSSLCALFYFGSLLCVILAVNAPNVRRKRIWILAAVVSGILAWMAKEEAITLPLVAAALLMLSGHRRWSIGVAAILGGFVILRWETIAHLYRVGRANPILEMGLASPVQALPYVLSEIKAAVFYYLSHFAVPLTQNVDPDFGMVQGILDPGFVVSAAALLILAVIAVRYRAREPLLTFAIAALLMSPLLAYAVIPLTDIVAEHRVYIAGLGVDLLAASILIRARRWMWPSVAVIVLASTLVTMARNTVWASDVRLWQQAEAAAPGRARPHLNLGAALQASGRPDEALVEYRHALSIRPDLPLVYTNMGTIYLQQSRLDDAEAMLKRSVELAPSQPQPYVNLGAIAVHRKHPDEALEYAAKAENAGAEPYWVNLIRSQALALRK